MLQHKSQIILFGLLIASGCMKKEESDIMALEFFAPVYLLMTVCDREPDREPEAQRMLEKHIMKRFVKYFF